MSNDTVKKTRVLTADDLASLLEAAVNKIAKSPKPTRSDLDKLKKRQNDAILHRELAQERRERVKKAVERKAPLEEQLAALGGEDAVSPLQLVKLKRQTPAWEQLAPSRFYCHNLVPLVLGPSPSTQYTLSRLQT